MIIIIFINNNIEINMKNLEYSDWNLGFSFL